jgi:hypothetical protein
MTTNVNQFMTDKLDDIRKIIGQLDKTFDSHAFILRFAHKFQVEYVKLLSQYSKQPFATIHSQIGHFLYINEANLGIRFTGWGYSENIFGNSSKKCKLEKELKYIFPFVLRSFTMA